MAIGLLLLPLSLMPGGVILSTYGYMINEYILNFDNEIFKLESLKNQNSDLKKMCNNLGLTNVNQLYVISVASFIRYLDHIGVNY